MKNNKPYIGQIIEYKDTFSGEIIRERVTEIEWLIGGSARVRVEPVSVGGYAAIGIPHEAYIKKGGA